MKDFNDYQMLEVRKELCNVFMNKHLRFQQSFLSHDYTDDEIRQSCDNELTSFMIETFGLDWNKNETAIAFYENVACDIRINAENDAIELYHSI